MEEYHKDGQPKLDNSMIIDSILQCNGKGFQVCVGFLAYMKQKVHIFSVGCCGQPGTWRTAVFSWS